MRVFTTLRDAEAECPMQAARGLSPRGARVWVPARALQARPGPGPHTGRLSAACPGHGSAAGARVARPEPAAPWRWALEKRGRGKAGHWPDSSPACQGRRLFLLVVNVVGWRRAPPARGSSWPPPSPHRSRCLSNGRTAPPRSSPSPRRPAQTLNFSGVQNLRRLLLPALPPTPDRPLSQSSRASARALSRSQLGRA